jgi:protein tyrosine phosphatase (PTP) superfamily phosphohydrolase (DUF442 family)
MTTTRWFRNFGSGRGAPHGRPRPARHGPVLALLAAWSLAQAGCTSLGIGGNGCSSCGGPFSQLTSRLSCSCGGGGLGLFHRRGAVGGDACAPGVIEGAPVVGAPAAVVPAPGGVITTPAPAAEDLPRLSPVEPEPPAGGTSAPQSRNSQGAGKAIYETYQPRGGPLPSRRGPAARPSATRRPPANPSPMDEALADLPPLKAPVEGDRAPASTLPEEATSRPSPPPSPPAAKPDVTPPSPAAAAPPPPAAGAGAAGAAPGIGHFKVVEPQLAGGSLPAAAGWAWLADHGYRTVLDLRERPEVQPADLAAIDQNGLIHVALPISATTIDARHLEQFRGLLAQAGSRPLYFFDTDGARAAVLWYIHMVATQKVEPATAAREVEELGPHDPRYWAAATAYLASLKPVTPAVETTPPPPATPAAEPKAQLDAAPATAATTPPAEETTAQPVEAPAPIAPKAAFSWRPYAYMILTGLSVPLAYFGRTILFNLGSIRASLPAPPPSPPSLPASSGD